MTKIRNMIEKVANNATFTNKYHHIYSFKLFLLYSSKNVKINMKIPQV